MNAFRHISFAAALCLWLGACNSGNSTDNSASAPASAEKESSLSADGVRIIEEPDSLEVEEAVDSVEFVAPSYDFSQASDILAYMKESPDSAAYARGILPVIIKASPDYGRKLIESEYSKFIIVDKATMTVRLYDRYGRELRNYGMACAKNYGSKEKKADSRTPEGFFAVQGTYDSTDWLFTDDNGVTSKKKGQFGPRFIRLKIPTTSQIGIHGTCAPGSIGHRASHGCIRITNDNILELVELVETGMPVIVNPGPRDVAVNEREGRFIPFIDLKGNMAKQIDRIRMQEEAEALRREQEAAAMADSIVNEPIIDIPDPVAPAVVPTDAPAPTESSPDSPEE